MATPPVGILWINPETEEITPSVELEGTCTIAGSNPL